MIKKTVNCAKLIFNKLFIKNFIVNILSEKKILSRHELRSIIYNYIKLINS